MPAYQDIYSLITSESARYQQPIQLIDGWQWSLYDHLRKSFLYKNSQFWKDNDDRDNRPFKNIVRPILNIQYRTEGFDVKDIELYVNDAQNYYKSFFIKKFHEKWALENGMDTFIDDLVESYVDYGGALIKKTQDTRPQVVDLLSLAFADQTDLLSGTFAIRHYFTSQQLREMKSSGWGETSKGATIDLETLIILAEKQYAQKKDVYGSQKQTPGSYIEIFEVHGIFPQSWLGKDSEEYVPQLHIVGFYKNQNDQNIGITLLKLKEPELPFKLILRDKVYGRAMGFGGVEELFEDQVWTNADEIAIQEMLKQASKVLYKSTDPAFKTRNNLIDADNGEIFTLQEGRDISQIDTFPRNLNVFNNMARERGAHAQQMGGVGEALLGESPSSGTPFKLQELVTSEAKSLHHWRQGKIATFVDEMYRDWILPHLAKEVSKGKKFLSELSADELQTIADTIVTNEANKTNLEKVLNGEMPMLVEEMETLKQKTRTDFLSGGNKKFIEILKDELKDAPLEISTDIKGKQKNLALLTDKIVSVLRQFIATPQIRQDPGMVKLLNIILESSGLSPIMFGSVAPVQSGGSTEPLQELVKTTKKATPVLEGALA